MDKFNDEWLLQYEEEALEPELPICDAHHHLWDYPTYRYLSEDLLADIATGHNIVSTVYMECMWAYDRSREAHLQSLGETMFIKEQYEKYQDEAVKIATCMVGNTDLSQGSVLAGQSLDAHLAMNPRFRGIRHASGWHASEAVPGTHMGAVEGLLATKKFRQGFAELSERGLSFDAWLYHTNIHELADLAKAFPYTKIVLDHCGGPLGVGPYAGHRKAVLEEWKRAITELSQHDNVVVKIGGLNMQLNGFAWETHERPPSSEALAEATIPFYMHCIEQFGVDRCMWQSNFPVDKVSCSYAVLWNSFKRITKGFSESEKAALYYNCAANTYRIEE